jgi:hypothetical protein
MLPTPEIERSFPVEVNARIRRLSPLILAHWPMDLSVAIMTGTQLGAAMIAGANVALGVPRS